MPEDIRCEVFRITFPDWSSVGKDLQEDIWKVMKAGVEDGHSPNRKSFLGINRFEDVIVGFFAHEGQRIGVQYDATWTQERETREEFEHLFFALALDEGTVVLQRKRVSRSFVALNLSTLRRGFFDLLTLALHLAGRSIERISVEPFRQKRDKGDLLAIFDAYPVTFVRVQGLMGQQVPEDVKLFNPNVDKDLILKQVLKDDFNHVDALEASSGQTEAGVNLRSAKVVRAAMLTGEPQVVKAVVDNQERTFRATQTEVFDMQLEAEPGERVLDIDAGRVVKVIKTEYFIPLSLTKSPVDLGPLFQLPPDNGENDGN